MRNTKIVSITLPPEMALEAERLAKEEGRTMSELMREAFRRYRREVQWDEANQLGKKKASSRGITEKDVIRLIKEFRDDERDVRTRRRKKAS